MAGLQVSKTSKSNIMSVLNEIEFYSRSGQGHKLHYEYLKNFNSDQTRRAYNSDLKLFFSFFSKAFRQRVTHPKIVERFHVVAYKEYLSKVGGQDGLEAAPKTIGRKLGALNSYFKFLLEKDIIQKNPCDGVSRPNQSIKTETNALSDEQVGELLNSLKSDTLTQCLHKALLFTLFGTGIRVSELINLKREDYTKKNGHTVIRFKAKGGKFRVLPLRFEVCKVIDNYIRKMSKSGRKIDPREPLFQPSRNNHTGELVRPLNRTTVMRVLKKSCHNIGIFENISPHSARATMISSLLEKGVDLYKVSLAAGHSNPKTTKHYDKRTKSLQDSALLEVDYFHRSSGLFS